jgi:hypothetical protein
MQKFLDQIDMCKDHTSAAVSFELKFVQCISIGVVSTTGSELKNREGKTKREDVREVKNIRTPHSYPLQEVPDMHSICHR